MNQTGAVPERSTPPAWIQPEGAPCPTSKCICKSLKHARSGVRYGPRTRSGTHSFRGQVRPQNTLRNTPVQPSGTAPEHAPENTPVQESGKTPEHARSAVRYGLRTRSRTHPFRGQVRPQNMLRNTPVQASGTAPEHAPPAAAKGNIKVKITRGFDVGSTLQLRDPCSCPPPACCQLLVTVETNTPSSTGVTCLITQIFVHAQVSCG